MKKFGFGKRSDDGDDSNRSALFGNKKASAAANDNPYAQAGQDDPYAPSQAMTGAQASYKQYQAASYGGGLPSGPRGGGGLPSGPRGGASSSISRSSTTASNETAPPPYSGGGGYGSDRYGASGGYGSNKYDNSGSGRQTGGGARGPGGYGGLGRTNSTDTDDNRDALFSGAQQRYEQRQQEPAAASGGYGSSGAGGSNYGGYGQQRELTAEEQEEEEVADIRRQIKETKLASASSAQNSERVAAQAVETALGTYARLGAQHERLNYTEGLLDKASLSTREAEGQTKKLKHLNRSMFAVHVNNPFTAGKKTREIESQALDQHRADRDLREATRKAGWESNAHMENGFKQIEASRSTDKWQRASAAEKSKYTFEDDDEEEDAAEEQIEESMRRTAGHVSTLNSVAKLMQKEIDSQDPLIERLGEKSDAVNDRAMLNTERLKRIH